MYLISDNVDTRTGMSLAGVEGIVVHEKEEIRKALNDALANREIGIILITEKIAKMVKSDLDVIKIEHATPLIVEIPDRHGTGRTKDSITKYVREAIGVKV